MLNLYNDRYFRPVRKQSETCDVKNVHILKHPNYNHNTQTFDDREVLVRNNEVPIFLHVTHRTVAIPNYQMSWSNHFKLKLPTMTATSIGFVQLRKLPFSPQARKDNSSNRG